MNTTVNLRKSLRLKHYISLLTLGLSFTAHVQALDLNGLTPEEQGLAIARDADRRDTGFDDFKASMVMELYNRRGDMVSRQIDVETLEVIGDGDKSLSTFNEPADVKGTKSLTFSHGLKPDDQWLYLPALKRVKRISSKNKSGPFMGSEFAFEDIGSQEISKYTYKLLGEENLNGIDTYKVERRPAYKHSGYTRQVSWVDKDELRLLKVDFYDRKNALLKTLNNSGYEQYVNQYWRPAKMEMVNHQTKKKTILLWKNYQFKTGLKSRDFNKNSLNK